VGAGVRHPRKWCVSRITVQEHSEGWAVLAKHAFAQVAHPL
jgi:hypothetical protein